MLNSGPVPPELGKGNSGHPLCYRHTGTAGPKAVPYPAPCASTQASTCWGVCSKGTESKTRLRPLLERSHAPDGAAAEPFGSALSSKESSHPLLRHTAVQGLEENLISSDWCNFGDASYPRPGLAHTKPPSLLLPPISITGKTKPRIAWGSSDPPNSSFNAPLGREHAC